MVEFLFLLIAGMTGLCAIATVVTYNIVRAATWLLFTLAGTSGIFFMLGADLVGAVQLLVYVGGTLVLVVFGVMLTAQGPFISMKTSSAEWAISGAVGVLLLVILGVGISQIGVNPVEKKVAPIENQQLSSIEQQLVEKSRQSRNLSVDPKTSPYSAVVGQAFLGAELGPPHLERPGGRPRVVRAHYLLPFEIVSVHLLVVLIGAAYLARAKRRRETAS